MSNFKILPSSFLQSFLAIACLIFLSCEKESSQNLVIANLFIDNELQPHFDRFVYEGKARGLDIDLAAKQIEGYLLDITEEGVVGQCTQGSGTPRKIRIDINYWNNATDLEREFVVFHELGHCYLERDHLDTQLNRNCTSIMHSGTSGCRFRYNTANRSAYLDELF